MLKTDFADDSVHAGQRAAQCECLRFTRPRPSTEQSWRGTLRRLGRMATVVLLVAPCLAGCSGWDLRRPDSASDDTLRGEQYRQLGPPGEAVGFDPRARDVERSLGVR